jgi:hypothetical protein
VSTGCRGNDKCFGCINMRVGAAACIAVAVLL